MPHAPRTLKVTTPKFQSPCLMCATAPLHLLSQQCSLIDPVSSTERRSRTHDPWLCCSTCTFAWWPNINHCLSASPSLLPLLLISPLFFAFTAQSLCLSPCLWGHTHGGGEPSLWVLSARHFHLITIQVLFLLWSLTLHSHWPCDARSITC